MADSIEKVPPSTLDAFADLIKSDKEVSDGFGVK